MLNQSLFQKYNVPGPRYTSYPTVPFWSDSPTEEQWLEHIRVSLKKGAQEGVGAAIYIHIPFCESLCTYCGCNTRITRNHGVGRPYVQTILKEWQLYFSKLSQENGKKIPVSEIHLGGGTPTFLTPQELEELILGIKEYAEFLPEAEFSVEADPRVTTSEHLQSLFKVGFKRLSLGIQDFDPKVQEIVHRVQSEQQVAQLTQEARRIGFYSINYDLIYGLPLQTLQSIEQTIHAIQRLRPDRIAFYSYAHVPWIKPSQRRFTESDLPDGDAKRALYELGRRMLEEVGYREIGMDHFALPTDSMWTAMNAQTLHRNFMGYTNRQVSPLIGLGVAAIGDSWTAFAQNEKGVEVYQSRVEKGEIPIFRGHILTLEDQVIRRQILNLMTRLKTQWSDEDLTYVPYLQEVAQSLREMINDGLVKFEGNTCEVPDQGRPFLRNICMAFDLRLMKSTKQQLFSKTI